MGAATSRRWAGACVLVVIAGIAATGRADIPPPRPRLPPLALSLTLTRGEQSKDSHARTFRVQVEGTRCHLSRPEQCKQGRCQQQDYDFDLTGNEIAQLRDGLARGELDRETFSEKHPTNQTGVYAKASLTVGSGGGQKLTTVEGMTKAWGKTQASPLTPAALAKLAAIEALLEAFEEALAK